MFLDGLLPVLGRRGIGLAHDDEDLGLGVVLGPYLVPEVVVRPQVPGAIPAVLLHGAARMRAHLHHEHVLDLQLRGDAEQGEWATFREAVVATARWRKSSDYAGKDRVLTGAEPASWLKGRPREAERGVSSGHSSCHFWGEGPKE